MKYQTDYSGSILNDGCLLCSLVTACEERVGVELSKIDFLELVQDLHVAKRCSYDRTRPVLSDEEQVGIPGAFVWDHQVLCNETLRRLGSSLTVRYTGRIYMPWEEARGKESFGTHLAADFIMLQVRTVNGGHFRLLDFDPWEPGTKTIDIKSVRYYRFRDAN